jgi:peptidoglycan/LPS O-acetylase OafA/YrhL
MAVPENVGANHLKRALSSRIAVIGSELSYSIYLASSSASSVRRFSEPPGLHLCRRDSSC